MGFGQAIHAALIKYSDFSSRSRRSEYWYWYLFTTIIGLVADFIPVVSTIVTFVILIPTLSVTVRRFHDIDRSGWWVLAPLAALLVLQVGLDRQHNVTIIIGAVATIPMLLIVIVWLCRDGTVGPNRFGEDPKHRSNIGSVFD